MARASLTIDPLVREVYPAPLIRKLVRFAWPAEVKSARIEMLPQHGSKKPLRIARIEETGRRVYAGKGARWTGRAWIAGPFAALISIRVPVRVPVNYRVTFAGVKGSRGYQGARLYSGIEALLYITAHELRHLWQRKIPVGGRVWGSRGRYSERDCDCYALRIVRMWRRDPMPKQKIHITMTENQLHKA